MTAPAPPDAAVPEACLNCGAVLTGRFCAVCGQKAQALRTPLGAFLADSFTEFFGLDGRVWRTVRDLTLHPGTLTVDFVDGRRTAALRPFRIYLTATLFFFVTLGLVNSGDDAPATADEAAAPLTGPRFPADSLVAAGDAADALDAWAFAVRDQRRAVGVARRVLTGLDSAATARATAFEDSLRHREARFEALRDSVRALPDTARVAAGAVALALPPGALADSTEGSAGVLTLIQEMPDWLKGDLARQVERARTPEAKQAAREAALAAYIGQIPTTLLVVLPVFAVLLKLLYLGGGGIELRARRRLVPPAPAPPGASRLAQSLAAVRLARWRVRQAQHRWQVRRRIGAARRPWRRAARRLRMRLPARMRATRFGWLRRAALGRRTRYYAEHVVFTLHVHAYTFLVFWVVLVIVKADGPGALAVLLVTTIPLHFLLAQRRVYAQTWGKTLVKSLILGTAYATVITLAMVGTAALAARLG